MEFVFESWPVEKILDLYQKGKINLNPPYQRNPIWSAAKQKGLIEALKTHSALPSFFVLEKENGIYEMVDGQQRTRTLIAYKKDDELNAKKGVSETFKNKDFLKYPLNVTIIKKLADDERIEDFYAKLNSSGVHLNRPETFKAKFFDKKFLGLVEELASENDFVELKLFPIDSQSKARMLDRDLVEELVALSLHGITDKKEQVNKIYESDITQTEADKAKADFQFALCVFQLFNKIKAINKTRFRQRNDFYTLFGYILLNKGLADAEYQNFYKVLLSLELGIRPDKNGCPPLAEYAFNCVSQSNSAKARQVRLHIVSELLGEVGDKTTLSQEQVINYYNLPKQSMQEFDGRKVFNSKLLGEFIEKKELKS